MYGPANLCMDNTYRIHHYINFPIINFCCATESGQNTCFISFEKQRSSGIIIPGSWCLVPLAYKQRALTPIFRTSITAFLDEKHTALLQSRPFLAHNLNLSSVNQESLNATFP